MKKIKRWTITMLCVMLALFAAACGNNGNSNNGNSGNNGNGSETVSGMEGGSNQGEEKESTELTFWSLGNNGYEALVEEWNQAHPDIQVKVQNTGDQTAHHNNMLTALSAGSGAPDIFMLEIAFVDKFLEATDKFYNLYDLGAKDIEGDYLEWKWLQASSKDGSFQLGVPTDIGPTVAYYRADLMEQAGLPTEPEAFSEAINTWDKFAEVGKQFTEKTGVPFTDLTDLLYNAVRDQSDGEIYFSKEDGSFIGEDNPQVKKAFDYTVQAIQEGWISNYVLWSPEWYEATNQGGFGVMLAPSWMIGTIKGNAPDAAGKWRIAQLPEGSGNWGGSFLTIPKEGDHPEEAYEFITWLAGKENQLKSFQAAGLMSSIPELYEDPEFSGYQDEYFGNQTIAEQFAEAASRINPMYYGGLHDTVDTYFKNALRNVIEKQADPQEEWEEAIRQAEQLAKRG
ncbi:extracellular solute-binding protein [Marinicrinis lubricantis]|uniref:Extracellular solute-binding protein n=1 Tax=Marinicrinis lubricantis TaxID=2086470 RepID=A0ABW1IHL4_9BACL